LHKEYDGHYMPWHLRLTGTIIVKDDAPIKRVLHEPLEPKELRLYRILKDVEDEE